MKCFYCQAKIDNVKCVCPNHPVITIHIFDNGAEVVGIILATTKYEVYLNFEDKNCNIYVYGKRQISLDHVPKFTPENMIDKVKTYLLFS